MYVAILVLVICITLGLCFGQYLWIQKLDREIQNKNNAFNRLSTIFAWWVEHEGVAVYYDGGIAAINWRGDDGVLYALDVIDEKWEEMVYSASKGVLGVRVTT